MANKRHALILGAILAGATLNSSAQEVSGYWQLRPVYTVAPSELADARVQFRLNTEWRNMAGATWVAESRTRLLIGDSVSGSFAPDARRWSEDPGWLDLTAAPLVADGVVLQTQIDRLYAQWSRRDWRVRAGRQRINWGVTTTTNPNDLFNSDSLYEFDYPERPGADAIRVERYFGFAGRAELAAAPGRDGNEPVVAGLVANNWQSVDWQVLTGRYRDRWAAGGGIATGVGPLGVKAEWTSFLDAGARLSDIQSVVAVSLDSVLANGDYVTTALLWNQSAGEEGSSGSGAGTGPDNPSVSEWQHSIQWSRSVTPLLRVNAAGSWYPGSPGGVLSPSVEYSVTQVWDASLVGQWRWPVDDSEPTGLVSVAARYSY